MMKLKLKVIPKASRNAIVGWQGEELKIRVTAAAEKGKANQAVIALLAKALGVSKQAVVITAGQTSSHKTVVISSIENPQQRWASIGFPLPRQLP